MIPRYIYIGKETVDSFPHELSVVNGTGHNTRLIFEITLRVDADNYGQVI